MLISHKPIETTLLNINVHWIWPCLSTAHCCLYHVYHSFCQQNVTTFAYTQKQGQQFHWGTEKAACNHSAFTSMMIPHGEHTTFSVLNMRIFFFLKCVALSQFSCFNTPKIDCIMERAMFDNLSKGEGREAVTLIIQNICKIG